VLRAAGFNTRSYVSDSEQLAQRLFEYQLKRSGTNPSKYSDDHKRLEKDVRAYPVVIVEMKNDSNGGKSLYNDLRKFARENHGKRDAAWAVEELGYRIPDLTDDRKRLERELLAYNRGSKDKHIDVQKMRNDKKNGGAQLYEDLRRFAKKTEDTWSAGRGARALGFTTAQNPNNYDTAELIEVLKAVYPIERVREAYDGNSKLLPIGQLEKINKRVYYAIKGRGTAKMINGLYPEFPDLYTYVGARMQSTHADPEILRGQLMQRYYAGRSLASTEENDRIDHRVMSLTPVFTTQIAPILIQRLRYRHMNDRVINALRQPNISAERREAVRRFIGTAINDILDTREFTLRPESDVQYKKAVQLAIEDPTTHPLIKEIRPSQTQITRALLPELNVDDIIGNSPATIKRNGTIGNLFVEWMLKWTMAMDPHGKFYRDGFRDIFKTPLHEVYAERGIETINGYKFPDLFLVGGHNTGVEVKSGEDLKQPLELADKYGRNWRDHSLVIHDTEHPLENLVAVLHMPDHATRKIAPRLADARYRVVDGEKFRGYLEAFVEQVEESPWQEHLAAAAPRIHNIRSFLSFYDQFAFMPATMTRPANAEVAAFLKENLERLVEHELEPAA